MSEIQNVDSMEENHPLINFMIFKNILVYKYTRIILSNREDFDELLSWGDDIKHVAWSNMIKNILKLIEAIEYDEDYLLGINRDNEICPWCIIHPDDCLRCEYGKRNGYCIPNPEEGGIKPLYRDILDILRGGKSDGDYKFSYIFQLVLKEIMDKDLFDELQLEI